MIYDLAVWKKCAAEVNAELGDLKSEIAINISQAAEAILRGDFAEHFPLVVWQTGSGTQTNMNMNEVIASVANKKLTGSKEGNHQFIQMIM